MTEPVRQDTRDQEPARDAQEETVRKPQPRESTVEEGPKSDGSKNLGED